MGGTAKIGERSEPSGGLKRGKGPHPFPSPDYRLARLARNFFFFNFVRPIFFRFLPHYAAWPQTNYKNVI